MVGGFMPNINSSCTIEQIYNLLMEDQEIRSSQQYEKIKRLLFELHSKESDHFFAEKPYKYQFHFNGDLVGLNAADAPRFSNKGKFLTWLFKKLKIKHQLDPSYSSFFN